jgi:hypothetical protein
VADQRVLAESVPGAIASELEDDPPSRRDRTRLAGREDLAVTDHHDLEAQRRLRRPVRSPCTGERRAGQHQREESERRDRDAQPSKLPHRSHLHNISRGGYPKRD